MLTIVGSIPSVLFFVFMLLHLYPLALLAFLGNVLDGIDGEVARLTNRVTPFGGFLDSTIDRVVDFLCISAFGFAGIVRWEIVVLAIFVSFLISYIRSRAELASGEKIKFTQGLITRGPRSIIVGSSLFLYLFFPSIYMNDFNIAEVLFLTLIVLSVYTVGQRMYYAYMRLKSE